MTITPGKIVHTDQVAPVRWAGEQGRFLLRSEDTGGLYTFFQLTTPPGEGPPFHIHDTTDEAFYVTDGAYDIRLGDDVHHAEAGTLVYGPRGVGHEFRNVAGRASQMLVIATPGGVEGFFEGLGKLLAQGGPPDWDEMAALAARHHLSGFSPQRRGPSLEQAARAGAGPS